MYNYNCPDCNEAKLQSDKNARKINEVIDQVNALIQVNNETVDFIEEKANEIVEEVAEREVNERLEDLNTEIDNINSSLDNNENKLNAVSNLGIVVSTSEELIQAVKNKVPKIWLNQFSDYVIDEPLTIESEIEGNKQRILVKNTITTTGKTILRRCNFYGDGTVDCINLAGTCIIEWCTFSTFKTAIKQLGICVHTRIKYNTIQYCTNGTILDNPSESSCNNFIYEENYHVKCGRNADDLSANGTESDDNYIGVGLYVSNGCNSVSVRKNVFEYNTFCGVLVESKGNSKTNDVIIKENYFEGNKIYAILVKGNNISTHQFRINDNFYAPKMTANTDFKNISVVVKNRSGSYYSVMDKNNIPSLVLGGSNVEIDDVKNCIGIGKKQYFSILHDKSNVYPVDNIKSCIVYKSKLKSSVSIKDGNNTSFNIYTFNETNGSEEHKKVYVDVLNNNNKYLTRLLDDDEYIEIYKYYIVD